MYKGPVVLIIVDGYGLRDVTVGNAVALAHQETFLKLFNKYPWLKLKAHGTAVGLPSDEDMGNSEVGHNAIGAGKVYAQGARLVNESLESGAIFQGQVWQNVAKQVVENNSVLHFVGLLSDGNVHSHISHLFKILDQAKHDGIEKVRVHILLDGRDVSPTSALDYVAKLENKLTELGGDYKIASGGGRQKIVMDRYEANWQLVALGWQNIVEGEGRQFASAAEAIEVLRQENDGVIDQDLPPFIVADNNQPLGIVNDHDAVIMFNFRGDRAIEISKAFDAVANETEFNKFEISRRPKISFASMLEYDSDLKIPSHFLVSPPKFQNTLGEFLAKNVKRQLALSETQKFGHVTYFFNGNRTDKFDEELETYIEVPSDKVSFDERPWMKSAEIADQLIEILRSGEHYDFIRVNFPNPDMVGHTGNLQSVIEGIEAVDTALARLLPEIDKIGGMALITADHGNAEEMYETKKGEVVLDKNGNPSPKTSHTLNPVPCIFYDNTPNRDKYTLKYTSAEVAKLGLSSFAQTVVDLLGLDSQNQNWDEGMIEIK